MISKIIHLIWKRKGTNLAFLLCVGGVVFGLLGIKNVIYVVKEQKSEVTLIGNAEEEKVSLESLSGINGVQYVTSYQEGTVSLVYGEYSGEFNIYGLEQEYLDMRYGDIMDASMDSEMPYVLLEESVFTNLKNEYGDTFKVEEQDLRMKTISIGSSAMKDARICGIISQNDKEKVPCIYTNQKGFEQIIKMPESQTIMEDIETSESVTLASEEVLEEKMADTSYFISIRNGRKIEQLIKKLEEEGMEVQVPEDLQLKLQEWERQKMVNKSRITVCILFLLCAGIAFYYQGTLWNQEHLDFIRWIKDVSGSDKVYWQIIGGMWVMLLARSVLLGGCVFGLVWLLFD